MTEVASLIYVCVVVDHKPPPPQRSPKLPLSLTDQDFIFCQKIF